MSEENKVPLEDLPYGPHDDEWGSDWAERHIKSLGAKSECLMCGNDSWLVMPLSQAQGTGVPIIRQTDRPLMNIEDTYRWLTNSRLIGSIPTVTCICKQCGFVKQHVLFPTEVSVGVMDDSNVAIATRPVQSKDFEMLKEVQGRGKTEE